MKKYRIRRFSPIWWTCWVLPWAAGMTVLMKKIDHYSSLKPYADDLPFSVGAYICRLEEIARKQSQVRSTVAQCRNKDRL